MVLVKVKGNKPFAPYASLSDSRSLLATWRATSVLGTSLEHGERLANLGWRMWSVRNEVVNPDEDEDAKAPGRKAFERRAKYTVEVLERSKAKSITTQGPLPYDEASGPLLEARMQTRRKALQEWQDKQSESTGKGKARQMDATPSGNASTSVSASTAAQRHPLRVRTSTPRTRALQGPLWPIVPSTALPEDPYVEPDPLGEPAWTIEAIEAAERELAAQGVDLQGPSLALLGDMKRAELARQCAARNRQAAIARAQAAAVTAGTDVDMGSGTASHDWPSSSSMAAMLSGWGAGPDAMRQTPMLPQQNPMQPFTQSPTAFDASAQLPGAPLQTNGLHPAVLSFLMQVVSAAQGQGNIQSLGALLGQMQPRPPQQQQQQQGEDPAAAFQQQQIHHQQQQQHPQQQHPQQQHPQQHHMSHLMQPGPSSLPSSMLQGNVPGQTPYYSPRNSFSLGMDGNALDSPHSVAGSLSLNQHQVGGGGPFHAGGSNASGLPSSMSMPGSPMGPYDAQTPFNFASPETHRARTMTANSVATSNKGSDESHRTQQPNAPQQQQQQTDNAAATANTAGSSTSGEGGSKPECANCGATSTPLWRRDEKFNLQCNACGLYLKLHKVPRPRMLKQRRAERVAKQAAAANGGDASGVNVSSPGTSDEWIGRNAGATCANCGTSTTPLWRKDPEGRIICNACGLYYKLRNAHRPVEMRADIIRKRSRYDERRPRDFSATPAAGASTSSSSGGARHDTAMAPPQHAHHGYGAQEGSSGLSNSFKPDDGADPTMQVPPPEGSVFLPTELLDSQACPMGAWGEACCQNLPLAPVASPTLAGHAASASHHAPSGVNLAEALRMLIAGGGVGSIANGANLPSDWASGLELDANAGVNAQGSNAHLYASPGASTGAGPTPNFAHGAYGGGGGGGNSGAPTPSTTTGMDESSHGNSKRQRTDSVGFAATTPRPHRANSQASEASNIAADAQATASLEAEWWASLANTPTPQHHQQQQQQQQHQTGAQHTNTPEGLTLQPPAQN